MKFKNNKLKIGFFITIIIVLILGLLKFGGVYNIFLVGSSYNVGDTFTIQTDDCQGSKCYSSCDKTIKVGDKVLAISKGTPCGTTSCLTSSGYKFTIADAGQKQVVVEHSNCPVISSTCNPSVQSCNVISYTGFSEGKTITVTNPVTPNCPINQVPNSYNTGCVAAPCKYTDLSTQCINNNLVKYSCYNTETIVCSGSLKCDLSKSTSSCYTPPVTTKTCYKCDGSTLMQETVTSCSSGFSTNRPTCSTPPPNTITCYKCEAGQILTETVTSCSSGYSTTQPSSCTVPPPDTKVTCYKCGTDGNVMSNLYNNSCPSDMSLTEPTCKITCKDNEKLVDGVCKVVEKTLWQKIVEWFQNLFKVN